MTASLEVRQTVDAALQSLAPWQSMPRQQRAAVLEAIAAALEARRLDILQTTSDETALTQEELTPEFARMVGTFGMFADIVRDGSWVRAAIDRPQPNPQDSIGPNHDVRRMLVPLGVAAVFGASNFPLSYGVCGGDTASALAAGCTVVVKEHPAHPKTGRLIHQIVDQTIRNLPRRRDLSLVGYVSNPDPGDHTIAQSLVQNEHVRAVGFTGSIKGGLALEKIAQSRPTPIPVFAEMGSTNPVFVTPGAMELDPIGIADKLADAILMRHGQQCTKPGAIFFAATPSSPKFTSRLVNRFKIAPTRAMLAPWIASTFRDRMEQIERTEAASLEAFSDAFPVTTDESHRTAQAQLWGTTLERWLEFRALQEEAFGPATVWVMMKAWDEQSRIPLGGHLTASIFVNELEEADLQRARDFLSSHAMSAGRIIFNGVPTGVRVAPGMVHGGPFPSTNRPDTTAVGPFAIERWCRPICFQNAPLELLPAELKDGNPTARRA